MHIIYFKSELILLVASVGSLLSCLYNWSHKTCCLLWAEQVVFIYSDPVDKTCHSTLSLASNKSPFLVALSSSRSLVVGWSVVKFKGFISIVMQIKLWWSKNCDETQIVFFNEKNWTFHDIFCDKHFVWKKKKKVTKIYYTL